MKKREELLNIGRVLRLRGFPIEEIGSSIPSTLWGPLQPLCGWWMMAGPYNQLIKGVQYKQLGPIVVAV